MIQRIHTPPPQAPIRVRPRTDIRLSAVPGFAVLNIASLLAFLGIGVCVWDVFKSVLGW